MKGCWERMDGGLRRFCRQRIAAPLAALLRQGLEPDQMARGFACGMTLGILPLPWGITPLCVLVAWRLGLNHAVVQTGNFLAWPLQLLFFIPFMRIGEYLLPIGSSCDFDLIRSGALFDQPAASLGWILSADLKALAGWTLVSWIFYLLSVTVSRPLFSRLKRSGAADP